MKILFEGYKYRFSDLETVFGKDGYLGWITRADNSGAFLSCVGYFYNKEDNTQFFIMPKVFAFDGDKAFGVDGKELKLKDNTDFAPIFDIDEFKKGKHGLDNWEVDVINKMPVYIFLAILHYRQKYQDSINNVEANLLDAVGMSGSTGKTFLEMIMSLQQFYNDHRQLFVYIYQTSHSGYNKINWARTVHTQTAIRNNNNYIYPKAINRRKTIDYDERLLVIFFSTLRYIKEEYNYPLEYENFYHLDSKNLFKRQAESDLIRKELKSIRQNYFRDELQELWQLLYNFYDIEHKLKTKGGHNEYLIVKKFDRIFEDMINDLIGDNYEDKRKELIEQKDGKIVDHLFLHRAVDDYEDRDEKVYYIGDSKYYKGDSIHGSSFYKQYTYAHNVIQQEIAWMLTSTQDIRYRNSVTEGYKITPNFFILGMVRPDYTLQKSELGQFFNEKNADWRSYQWENRLFDRDTLFLEQYHINFLYVLDSYVHADAYKNKKFKEEAKEKFRNDFIEHLNNQYNFHLLRLRQGWNISDAMDQYFRLLNGKVYIDSEGEFDQNNQYVLLAYEKKAAAEAELLEKISSAFEHIPYILGENVQNTVDNYNAIKEAHRALAAKGHQELTLQRVAERDVEDKDKNAEETIKDIGASILLVGCYKNKAHYDWIIKSMSYNVRLGTMIGSVSTMPQRKNAKYLLLYNVENPTEQELFELFVSKHDIKTRQALISEGYPSDEQKDANLEYFIYHLKGEIATFQMDNEEFQQILKFNEKGAPFYTELSRIIL